MKIQAPLDPDPSIFYSSGASHKLGSKKVSQALGNVDLFLTLSYHSFLAYKHHYTDGVAIHIVLKNLNLNINFALRVFVFSGAKVFYLV